MRDEVRADGTRRTLSRFVHVPGVHCGSTSMSDVFRHQGHDLSEAMCFGLGAGLQLVYLRDFGVPSRVLHGRGLTMEQDLCAAVGATFRSVTEPDAAAAWRRVKQRLDQGFAVVLQCDVRLLPHYRSTLPFNGHRVVLAGYDGADETALVADTHFDGLVAVPQADLAAARASDGPPAGYSANLWWEIEAPAAIDDMRARVRGALALCGRRLLDTASPRLGVIALEAFVADLPGWDRLPDAQLCTSFGYQVIEKRGTGGALFRHLYRDFLVEAETRWPGVVPGGSDTIALATRTASGWTELADRLRRAFEFTPPAFNAAAEAASRVVELERELATRLASAS